MGSDQLCSARLGSALPGSAQLSSAQLSSARWVQMKMRSEEEASRGGRRRLARRPVGEMVVQRRDGGAEGRWEMETRI